ncbi:ABC transporter ATP-binding protein [Acholeplasma vituli]|uniref:ABC transporter ATP-binding protein n=1 Tax=Paracholeplasma vituli TaxID=69473 RepID=A0ABT2PUL6_9MOLU|nr:ABC transporter ATP-binding protein [Paracholeplasma vituli]MCU0104622.1 ABC transporter ATP-binding protein [Paracholeplasma vituli]
MHVIEIQNLKKYYGTKRGLESATLYVKKGEIYGFIGPNGAGKTTLIRILMGLLPKTDGVANVFGKPCQMGDADIQKRIGYMPSDASFFPEYKVSELISFFGAIRKPNPKYVEKLCHILDIDLDKTYASLSFGNKKKIGILVALMHEPELLVLDEPTTGLDPLIQKQFLDELLELKSKGVTIFLSSHVLSDIQKVCDRVGLIKNGIVILENDMHILKKEEHKIVEFSPFYPIEVPNMIDFQKTAEGGTFKYQGGMTPLLKTLSQYEFTDVVIRDVSLEEIFLSYYESEDYHD